MVYNLTHLLSWWLVELYIYLLGCACWAYHFLVTNLKPLKACRAKIAVYAIYIFCLQNDTTFFEEIYRTAASALQETIGAETYASG